jgi:hypothetical protein
MALITAQANLMPIGAENRLPSVEEFKQADPVTRRAIRAEYIRRGLKPPHMSMGRSSPNKGRPNSSKGKPRPHMQGVPKPTMRHPKPHVWLTGPDPERHKLYVPFLKQKAQAMFRKELWDLTFDQWEALWDGRFHLRGRRSDDLCMTMSDPDLGWTTTNAVIVTRREQLKQQMTQRMIKRWGNK